MTELHTPTHPVRFVTAASLFDGHDASINIMRRILQSQGAEVIHLGHNRSVDEVVDAALEEDVQGVAVSSYQGGHVEYFEYLVESLRERGRRPRQGLRRRRRRDRARRDRAAARSGRHDLLARGRPAARPGRDDQHDRPGVRRRPVGRATQVAADAVVARRPARRSPGRSPAPSRAAARRAAGRRLAQAAAAARGRRCSASPAPAAPASPRSPTSWSAASASTSRTSSGSP